MTNENNDAATYDVVVAGAGFAGLYLLHRLRKQGRRARAFETGSDVGGTWFWNRYPGARCDVQSVDYSYSFDPDLEVEWTWSEKYATQPEILRYLQHVADKHDLRRDISFNAKIEAAEWDATKRLWHLNTSAGDDITARYYVMATGCLSVPKDVDIQGASNFKGESYFTSSWPHDGVDLTGKRVAVIGTGSSAIQSIPIMAEQAETLTVFQRTPNFSMPAFNGPIPAEKKAAISGRTAEYREEAKWTQGGVPGEVSTISALAVSDDERNAILEAAWAKGDLFAIITAFSDTGISEAANAKAADFLRNKIRSIVNDPETAETLCPKDYPFGTKRPCLDSGYFETFNRPNVRLVDLRKTPLKTITETGIETSAESLEFDVIVFATGFDAMTGAIVGVDVRGRDGMSLAEKWADGPKTYLGLMIEGFPNFFTVTGPGSPSVLSNMAVSIEQHVDWICETIQQLQGDGFDTIEPTETAENGWVQFVNDAGDITLFPKANSWYMGANVPGKPRVFLPFVGGVGTYRRTCDEVVAREYLGFRRSGADSEVEVDGIIRPLQPDVMFLLEAMAAMDLPDLVDMTPDEARAFMAMGNEARPPGPDVGERVIGTFPGASGDLTYCLYRPATPGPHPVVVYYHGGGWVLGDAVSDDPFCRDLSNRADAIIVSVDYRHAPEARFPAAVDDAFAALQWVSANTRSLGGTDAPVAVCGWSAGGNLAAVVCQMAVATGGPVITGQVLITPVTDCDMTRGSYQSNGTDFVLTADLMRWFWDHYADETERLDPKASPLRADDLSGLPPTLIVTSEFDPLRDEGMAYAAALSAAGVDCRNLQARGHLHTSIHAVDIIISGGPVRAEIAAALKSFFGATIPA